MKPLLRVAVFFLLLASASGQDVTTYKANGLKWGRTHGAHIATATSDEALGATYYDAIRVFQQLAEATGQDFSVEEAAALKVYRDGYVIRNNGGVPGYWMFSDGLTEHHLRTGDEESKRAALLFATRANTTRPAEWTAPASVSREVSYAILAILNGERLGQPRSPARLTLLFTQALGHIDQWFQAKTEKPVPFMVGLTATALIRYHDQIEKDPRIVKALKQAADGLWANAWRKGAFYYDDASQTPAPDLNLLIMPLYAFLYRETSEPKYREQAVQIFNGGVEGAWLDGPKQFNQTYLRGWEALKWINAGPTELDLLRAEVQTLKAKIESAKDALK
jgi:hypothetical protein